MAVQRSSFDGYFEPDPDEPPQKAATDRPVSGKPAAKTTEAGRKKPAARARG